MVRISDNKVGPECKHVTNVIVGLNLSGNVGDNVVTVLYTHENNAFLQRNRLNFLLY